MDVKHHKIKVCCGWRKAAVKAFPRSDIENIEEDEVSRVLSYKYLGIIINENMAWGNHNASLLQKVARSGKKDAFVKKNQSPNPRGATFNFGKHYDNTIFLIMETLRDRKNKCLMKTLQVLHNKCAKLILNM